MSNESSLTSVVSIPHYVEKWERLQDHDALAQLHARFWGTSMQEEEEACQWRSKERLTPAPSDNNRKPNEKPGNGTDESEDDDDDIIPGSNVLDINNDAIGIKRIWVRAEFIRIYDYLVDYYNTTITRHHTSPSAVVTGQPGIGKSAWLFYALRRCLGERRPVVLRYRKVPFLFVEDGVYQMQDQFQLAKFKSIVWTLVDSDESLPGVPEEFVTQNTRFFVIYVSSPAKERWSRLHKTTINAVIVMNPWSRGEIHRAAKLYPNTLDSKLIDDIYDRFGPTPRLCIQTASDSEALASHECAIRTALEGLTPQTHKDLIYKVKNLRMDVLSHKVCLVKRQNVDNVRSVPYVQHITDHIRSRIAIRMRSLDSLEQVKIYRALAYTPSRGAAGHIFESFCQQQFQVRILIEYVPMIRLTRNDGRRKRQWHSSHHPVVDGSVESLRQNASRRMGTLDIRPSSVLEYHDNDLQGLTPAPDVYYIPSTKNAVAVDSFIYHSGSLFLFQFTVSHRHEINAKFMSRFAQCAGFPPRSKWRFIFVIPDDVDVLTCPYSQSSELQALKLFSSKVKMEEYMKVTHLKGREEKEEEPPHKKRKGTEAPVEGSIVDNGEGSRQQLEKPKSVKASMKGKLRSR